MNAILSAHAAARWDQRAPADAIAPEVAWEHAQRVDGLPLLTGTDECRVHQPTRTVLLRRDSCIVSVLSERELSQDEYRYVAPVLDAGAETPA